MRFAPIVFALTLFACSGDSKSDTSTTETSTGTTTTETTVETDDTIIGVADSAGDFTTLLAAVDAAGLTETLQGDGPFTVFAPTDAAFAALPEGTVEALLADVPTLTDILLYHAVGAEVSSTAVAELSLVTALNGVDLKVTTDGGVFINEAEVTVADVQASNGVIHIVDAVLLPPPTITDIARDNPDFSILYTALQASDLDTVLMEEGPYTVFAPTDAAFGKLPEGTVDALLGDIPALTDILLYHVHAGRLPAADVLASANVTMAQGDDAAVAMDGATPTIAGAAIVATDIPSRNGLIHILDDVMLPPE
ncbi:MAG: fasciclin domain-containing protein [Rhodobacterales bacterium]|nr:fasciclin domain-containing protein [Rhodobacterales bacterium]